MNAPSHAAASDSVTDSETALAHVLPLPLLLGVFAALLVLTVVTVAVSYFDFGPLNLFVAMGIATVKAALVALYFMHLRYDSLFNGIIFLIGVVGLGLFIVITMIDTIQYQPDVRAAQEGRL